MNSHLVTVEVGVERCTSKRMKLNSSSLYQDRLKCLNTKSVKCRSTVKKHRMLFNNCFKYIPYLRLNTFYHSLRTLNIVSNTLINEVLHYEGFEQFYSHFLGKTALINLKFGTNNDNRTAGIVDTLTKKVLSETSLLTLKHIGKRLKSSVAGACYRSSAAAVVNQCVNSFLEHSLFVSYDNFGCLKL